MKLKFVKLLLIFVAVTFSHNLLADEQKQSAGQSRFKDSSFTTVSSTKFDFEETLIDGQMKAPSGFFLQGRNAQSLSQMVKLRSHFKRELKNSKSAVKSIIK